MSQVEFKTAIVDAITGSGDLDTYIGSRIYETEAPTDADGEVLAQFPYMVYSFMTDVPPPTMVRVDFETFVQFDLFDNKVEGTATISINNDLVFDLFHKKPVAMANHTGVQGYAEDKGRTIFESRAVRVLSQYSFRGSS